MTLEGTIIHKSGLITGGRSTHGHTKKWEEKDIQGIHLLCITPYKFLLLEGLYRVRDSLLSQLRDLNKSKPRSRADEGLLAEITRLESTLALAKDDLVHIFLKLLHPCVTHLLVGCSKFEA